MPGRPWTNEEVDFVKQNYIAMSCEEMAIQIGRSTRAVQHLFGNLGLERPKPKVGDEFGRLEILSFSEEKTPTQVRTLAKVRCKCGTEKVVRLTAIVQGKTVSCGCWKAEKASERLKISNRRHGLSKHPLYSQYNGMVARCTYDSQKSFKDYGGRGIRVCQEWLESFQKFYDWAIANGWKLGLTIDRRNTNGNYEPDNCRFATCLEQANNTRSNTLLNAFGEVKTIAEWSRDKRCLTGYMNIITRISLGWNIERSIITPTRKLNRTFL